MHGCIIWHCKPRVAIPRFPVGFSVFRIEARRLARESPFSGKASPCGPRPLRLICNFRWNQACCYTSHRSAQLKIIQCGTFGDAVEEPRLRRYYDRLGIARGNRPQLRPNVGDRFRQLDGFGIDVVGNPPRSLRSTCTTLPARQSPSPPPSARPPRNTSVQSSPYSTTLKQLQPTFARPTRTNTMQTAVSTTI